MQKNNQSKKPTTTPAGANPIANSGRPKKEKPSKDTKKSRNLTTGKRTPSNTKVKTLTTSVSSTDNGGGLRTAEEAKSADNQKKMVTKKRQVREKELKLEPTQQDDPAEKQKEEKKEEPQSGMDVLVKDDKKAVKMDDGYEDFGPGAA